jgi:2-dehydro-3-deoxyphosphooctonate aldolase (KDO 8-P synthase)
MKKFIYIAGPCVIESEELVLEIATQMKKFLEPYPHFDYYFKASFDKANRSAHDSFRGPGLSKGLKILEKVRNSVGVKVLTDVHDVHQCEPVASVVDALQIPAFLCRQTDLLLAATEQCLKFKRKLNVKKGQFLAPWDMNNVVEKVQSLTKDKPDMLWLTERGSTFGYNNLVVDMSSFPLMKQFGMPVIFDATHSVQLPGKSQGGKTTGGRRELIAPLSRAAVAIGIDGIFMETHPDPRVAKSDAENAFPLNDIPGFLKTVVSIQKTLPELYS